MAFMILTFWRGLSRVLRLILVKEVGIEVVSLMVVIMITIEIGDCVVGLKMLLIYRLTIIIKEKGDFIKTSR